MRELLRIPGDPGDPGGRSRRAPRLAAVVLATALSAATLAAGAGAPSAAPEGPELVPCYDRARELVQQVARSACTGEVVTPERAAALRAAQLRARAARLGEAFRRPEGQPATRNGSGVVVSPDGHVLTARHVIEGCGQLTVRLPDQSEVRATAVRQAADRDLAVLRLEAPAATWARLAAAPARDGSAVTVAGYPVRGRLTVRPVQVSGPVVGALRIDGLGGVKMALGLRVHPGLSGGPVVGPDGRVVGVVIAMLDRSAVFKEHGHLPPATAFAEPLADLRALLTAAGVVLPGESVPPAGAAGIAAATVRIDCAGGR